jgi:hypothetical protein
MFFIPGFVIAALTFPGVIIHEAGHLFFCRLFKLQVFDLLFPVRESRRIRSSSGDP